jgi:Arc/MetJ-type ribon-helix-helix transcriptional regulator
VEAPATPDFFVGFAAIYPTFLKSNKYIQTDCTPRSALGETAGTRRSVQRSRELEIDRADLWRYFGGIKIKTSVTLSNEVLKAIDLYIGEYRSRSEFIETAARKFIAQLARKEAERRDLELINRHSDSLNAEAEDVLTYQVPL